MGGSDDDTVLGTREPAETEDQITRTDHSGAQHGARLSRRDPAVRLSSGQQIGRFMVIDSVGAGGMGEVYAAYDPDLDRRVALKILRANSDEQATERLRREAQALARLAHPNVVAVYDVGVHMGQVFVAMEYVEGTTLKSWLLDHDADDPEHRAEALDILRQAGRGLQAAHNRGLIHRDFKPSNVLVGDDGRVRVADFGLARGLGRHGRSTDTGPNPAVALSTAVINSDLTKTGAIVGTPAYMAPEQYAGTDLDQRADQFAFGVVAWRAMYGRRPFLADTPLAFLEAIEAQTPSPPSDALPIPPALEASLLRSLAYAREDRDDDLGPILDAVEDAIGGDAEPTSRRRLLLGGLAVAGVAAATAVGAYQLGTTQVSAPCANAEAALAPTWDDERREQLATAMTQSPLPYADETWQRLAPRLDRYSDDWATAHRSACEATAIDRVQSDEVLTQRMMCLDRARRRLGAFVELLAAAKPDAVEHALETSASLPEIGRCADLDFLAAEVEPPADAAAETVDALRDGIARAQALASVGRHEQAIARLSPLRADVEATDYAPLVAEFHEALADAYFGGAQLDRASSLYLEAYAAWRRLDHPPATLATAEAMTNMRIAQGRLPEADVWGMLARTDADRIGTVDARRRRATVEASLARARGDYPQEVELRTQALADATESGVASKISRARIQLAEALVFAGQYVRAEQLAATTAAESAEIWGEHHPSTGRAFRSLCDARARTGDYEGAIEAGRHAVDILTAAHGAQAHAVATANLSLGHALARHGKLEQARDLYEIVVRTLHQHPSRAETLAAAYIQLGHTQRLQGRLVESGQALDQAITLLDDRLGPDHPRLPSALYELANVELDLGELTKAEQHFSRAQALWRKSLGDDHPNVASATVGLAHVLEAGDSPLEAVPLLEQVYAQWKDRYPNRLAGIESSLGRTYEQAGQLEQALVHTRRSRELAREHLGDDDWIVASTTAGIGSLLLDLGRTQESIEPLEEGNERLVKLVGRRSPEVAFSTRQLCIAHDRVGDLSAALPYCDWALDILDAIELRDNEEGMLRAPIVSVLWKDPARRQTARAVATAAIEHLEAADKLDDANALERWLAKHGGPLSPQ